MMKTKRVKDTGGDASKATYLKLEQIKEIQQKYIQGKLNHFSPIRKSAFGIKYLLR